VTTLAEQVDADIVPERLMAVLAGFFGTVGALLAAIGFYGLLAYTVARRTKEIGFAWCLARRASTHAADPAQRAHPRPRGVRGRRACGVQGNCQIFIRQKCQILDRR